MGALIQLKEVAECSVPQPPDPSVSGQLDLVWAFDLWLHVSAMECNLTQSDHHIVQQNTGYFNQKYLMST